MATARRRHARNPRTAPQEHAPPVELTDPIGELLEEFGASEINVRLFRQRETPPRTWLYVATLPFASTLLDDVQSAYGGGDYRCICMEGSQYIKGKTFTFSIAGPPRARGDDEHAHESATQREIRELRELVNRPPPPSDTMEKTIGLFTGLVAALAPMMRGGGGNSGGAGVVETLQLVQDAEQKGEERGERLGRLAAGIGGGGGDNMVDVLKSYAPTVNALMTARANGTAHKGNLEQRGEVPVLLPMPGQTGDSPQPPAPVQPSPEPTPVPHGYDFLPYLRPGYGWVKAQAAMGNNAALVAEFVVSQFSEELEHAVTVAATRDDFRAVMRVEFAQIAAAHPAWLEEFLAAIEHECAPAPITAPPPPPPPAKSNGKKRSK